MEKERVLEFSSKIENIRILEKLIDEISEELNISEDSYGNILIALLEAANNAIVHGNNGDESKNVVMKFWSDSKYLKVSIYDEGPGFDYNHVPDPTSPENLEKLSGRGIFLMEKLSDKIEFFENGSHVLLTFNI